MHCSLTGLEGADFSFNVEFEGEQHLVSVKLRPHYRQFLEEVNKHYEVFNLNTILHKSLILYRLFCLLLQKEFMLINC